MITANEYTLRRNKLLNTLDDNSVTILFAGVGKKKSGDENYEFVPNKNFYYLTGIKQENSILMLVKTDGEKFAYLFIDEKDERIEKWIGYKLSAKEAKDISGIENVFLRNTFDGKMLAFFESNDAEFEPIKKFYLDLEDELKIDTCKSTKDYKDELLITHQLDVLDVHDIIMKMRMVKSEAEIEMIKDAINLTETGLMNCMLKLAPSKFEYNLRNEFNFVVHEDLDSRLAFSSIVAGGKNATILHYPSQKDKLRDGDLVLFDVGAAKDFYCGDISRTYPVNEIVLNCNKQTAGFMRPGVTLKEVNEFAKNFLAEECFEKGLISSKDEITRVYYHSVSHHLGLDTHDGTDRVSVLVPGNVITCEPGLYFKEFGIGVRIEDDILITETGSEVLSANIIKEVKDIEKAMESK